MPAFDMVSEVDKHELTNAVDQVNREITTRFDLKGTGARIEQSEKTLTVFAESEFHLDQVLDIMRMKLVKRGIDVKSLEIKDAVGDGKMVKQTVLMREGIERDLAKKIITLIKGSKIKVQTAIQGENLRVTGKKRDDLQKVMALLRAEDFEMPLQFNNFRE